MFKGSRPGLILVSILTKMPEPEAQQEPFCGSVRQPGPVRPFNEIVLWTFFELTPRQDSPLVDPYFSYESSLQEL